MLPFTFHFLTDVHHYSAQLGTQGAAYARENAKNQKLLGESGKAIAAAFAQIAADTTSDTVLINGDLTNNGEMESHREIIAMLRVLQQAGKRVFVTTATHDYRGDGETAYRFSGDEKIPVPTARHEELFEMYRPFGPDQAIDVHRESMSYAAQLADGVLLLAMNDDSNGNNKSGWSDALFDWAKAHIRGAQANGQTVILMTHHPLIAPSAFYAIIGKNDMMGDHEIRRAQLAGLGVGIAFTGHSHIHNISYVVTPENNVLFDVSTSALAGYPGYYRRVTVDPDSQTMRLESVKTEGFDDALNDQLFGMIRRVINAAAENVRDLAELAVAFSVKKHKTYAVGWLIRPLAKWVRKLRVGTLYRLCKKEAGLTPQELEAVCDIKVMELIIRFAMNLYGGDGAYTPDTPVYKVTMGFLSVIDAFLEVIHQPVGKFLNGVESLQAMLAPLLYKRGVPDHTAVLPLVPSLDDVKEYETPPPQIRSRKGAGVLAALIGICLILLPFLPLIALGFGIGYAVNYIRYRKEIQNKEE